jgi:Protein of unknown function (DUF2950)
MSISNRYCIAIALLALAFSLASCSRTDKAAEKVTSAQTAPRTFQSPAEAGTALFAAAKAGDRDGLLAIFGPDAKEVLFSGDDVVDKNNRERFVTAYSQMNRWSANKTGGEILFLGDDNFPFPIPLKKNDKGSWFFDTAAGKDEVLARRIGNDELVAINVLDDIAGAQDRYFKQAHDGTKQYAQKFVSDPGQQNGLYWEAAEGQPASPLGPLGDAAKELGYSRSDKPQPFNGYYYRILTKQGANVKGGSRDFMADGKLVRGFAVIAYPAKYGDSGIMTFIVGPDGVVYQKDLGEKTSEAAVAMTEYNPDQSWASLSAQPIPGSSENKTARK